MEKQTISQLTQGALTELKKQHYAEISVAHFKRAFIRIEEYAAKNGIMFLSDNLTSKYMQNMYCWDVKSKNKPNANITFQLRAFKILKDYLYFKRIPGRTAQDKDPLESFTKYFTQFINECTSRKLSDKTIKTRTCDIYDFLTYAEYKGFKTIADIDTEFLDEYFTVRSNKVLGGMQRLLSSVRCFLRSMFLNNIIQSDISALVPSKSRYPVKPVQKLWTSDEVKNLLSSVERTDSMGKRDYAIMLLVIRYGIRAGDICSLNLADINWDSMSIQLRQNKTSVVNVLPILDDVGWALADWITNARPKQATTNHVFTRMTAPYCGMSDIYEVFVRRMVKARISTTGCGKAGPHSLRHALASGMLAGQIPLPVITSVLGHSSSESTMVYLHSNTEELRQCALDVEEDGR